MILLFNSNYYDLKTLFLLFMNEKTRDNNFIKICTQFKIFEYQYLTA